MASASTSNTGTIQPHQNGAPSKVELIIHHQFPGIKLVFPMYASDSSTCYLPPDQYVVVGSTAQVGFNIKLSWGKSIGILVYELKNMKQSHKNAISSEDEATHTQLVIIWEISNFREFHVYSCLTEHDRGHTWDRDNLMKLAELYELHDIQHVPVEETYLMHDHTVLMKRVNVTYEEECYKLEMTISETSIKDDTQRLHYINVGK
jgi:hypothetical protein